MPVLSDTESRARRIFMPVPYARTPGSSTRPSSARRVKRKGLAQPATGRVFSRAMFTFRARFLFGLVVACSTIGVACGSDDSGSSSNKAPFEPAGNGQPIDESPACQALKEARD